MIVDYLLKKLLIVGMLYYWRPRKYSENFLATINKFRLPVLENLLAKSDKWRAEIRAEIQINLLTKILAKAALTPFWKVRFENNKFIPKIGNLEDLEKLPVLTKEEIKNHNLAEFFPPYLDENWAWLITTSGTTGEKTYFLQDKFSSAVTEAFFRRALKWAGLENPNRILIINFFKSWSKNCGTHINIDYNNFKNIWFVLNQHEPEGLFADVDLLVDLATELENQDKIFKLKSVVYNGRLLFEHERELIERIFGCGLFSLYGASECGIIASECSAHNGLHINMERVYVETVNNSIIITVFDDEVMPLIRYKIGDIGSIKNLSCSCGLGLPRLFLEGREKNGN